MKQAMVTLLLFACAIVAYGETPKRAEVVRLNGLDTYYEVYGQGEPLFFLHGATQSSALWHEYVADFADSYTVYLVDLLGHGRSTPLKGGFADEDATRQFAALLQHLGIERFSGVGYSLGGGILLQFATLYPDRLQRMLTVGGTHEYRGTGSRTDPAAVTEEEMQRFREVHVHGDDQITALLAAFWNPSREFLLDVNDVTEVATETLIVMGEHDRIAAGSPLPSIRKAMELHELLPHSHLWIVPDEGHSTFDGKGKPEFVRVAREFFGGAWR